MATLEALITDPSVSGQKASTSYPKDREKYIQRYQKYIAVHNLIAVDMYVDGEVNHPKSIYYYIPIHSDGNEEVMYDIVLQFIPPTAELSKAGSVRNWDVKIFSNSPGFMFKYAYLYNRRKMIPTVLLPKFTEETLRTAPSKSNPSMYPGFDAPLFYAMYYLYSHITLLDYINHKDQLRPFNKFPYDSIVSPEIVNERRNPSTLNAVKKLESNVKKIVKNNPVTRYLGSAKPAEKAKRPQSASNAKKPIKPKKAIVAITGNSPSRRKRK